MQAKYQNNLHVGKSYLNFRKPDRENLEGSEKKTKTKTKNFRRTSIRITPNFSPETMQWSEIFKVGKEKIPHQPRILYSSKLFFKSKWQIKTFSGKQKLRDCITSRSALQKMLKEDSEK